MGDALETDVCAHHGVLACTSHKKVNHKNKRRKRYMHIKYEIFEERNEGDFCNIEKAQVETCT